MDGYSADVDRRDPVGVLIGGLAERSLVEPDGLGDPLQRLVQGEGLGVPPVDDVAEPRRRGPTPHTDGGTVLICPMNVRSIAPPVSSLQPSIFPATVDIRPKSVFSAPLVIGFPSTCGPMFDWTHRLALRFPCA